jgi:HK97 family phage portal protein
MGIVRDILERAARRVLRDEQRYYGATVTTADEAGQDRRHRTHLQQVVMRWHSWFWRCSNINAEAVASVRPGVYRRVKPRQKLAWASAKVDRYKRDHLRTAAGMHARKMAAGMDDVEEITDFDHPLVALLSKVNPMMNGFEFMYAMQISYEVCGVGYCFVVKQGGVPVQLWPLQPQYVRAVPGKGNLIARYEYGRNDEVEETFGPDEVVALKNWSLLDPYHGYGPLQAMLPDVDLTETITEFRRSVLDRACQPGLIVTGRFGSEAERSSLEAKLNAKHAGAKKAGRSLVANVDPEKFKIEKWEPGGDKTLGYITDEDKLRDKVAAITGVPRALLTAEDLPLANVKTGVPIHQIYTVRPRVQRIEDTLNERVVPLFGDDQVFVAFDECVDRDEEAQSRTAVAEYAGGLRMRNEARAVLRLEPVPDGDEFSDREAAANAMSQLEAQARLQPEVPDDGGDGEDGGKKPPPEKAAKEVDGVPIHGDGRGPVGDVRGNDTSGGGGPAAVRKASDDLLGGCAGTCCTHHPRTGRDRTKDDRRDEATDTAERNLERALRSWFRMVLPSILLSDDDGPAVMAEKIRTHLSLPSVRESFVRAVGPEVARVFAAGYDDGLDLLGPRRPPSMGAFAVTADDAVRFLDGYSIELSQGVTQTVADRLTAAIQAGVENADSIPQLTRRVKEVMGDITDNAAENIARTEAARAYGEGRLRAWTRSGVVERKEILLSADPCEVCQAVYAAKRTVELNQPFLARGESVPLPGGRMFTNDYRAANAPPFHPRCRCSTGAVFTAEVQADIDAAQEVGV